MDNRPSFTVEGESNGERTNLIVDTVDNSASAIHDEFSLWPEDPPEDGLDAIERMKHDQDCLEVEVLRPGLETTESIRAWNDCIKNPGHPTFIPVSEFHLEQIPFFYRANKIFNQIRTLCKLTVRLRGYYISSERPDGYAFSNHRGSEVLHTGSGWVDKVDIVKNLQTSSFKEYQYHPNRSLLPDEEWYAISIRTTRQVVFNTEEALSTAVDFFYDGEASMAEGKVKTLHGWKVVPQGDTCELICITFDKDFVMHLKEGTRPKRLGNSLFVLSRGILYQTVEYDVQGDAMLIVSHPHGQPKQITMGVCVKSKNDHFSGLMYTADTCPGSSGAPVLVLPNVSLDALVPHMRFRTEGGVANYSLIAPTLTKGFGPNFPALMLCVVSVLFFFIMVAPWFTVNFQSDTESNHTSNDTTNSTFPRR